jgi:hypothetical protein
LAEEDIFGSIQAKLFSNIVNHTPTNTLGTVQVNCEHIKLLCFS